MPWGSCRLDVETRGSPPPPRVCREVYRTLPHLKAYIGLDGRYFGGRHIWVCFFKEADFDGRSLDPSPSEPK